MSRSSPYTFLEHTADIKFKLHGSTLNEIFEHAVLAVAQYINSGAAIASKKGKVIEVQGIDTPSLLANFIGELLYQIDAEHFAPAKASVLLRGNNLKAELFGDDTRKYHLTHIKAATYADMEIAKKKNGWEAIVVLDV